MYAACARFIGRKIVARTDRKETLPTRETTRSGRSAHEKQTSGIIYRFARFVIFLFRRRF